MKRRELLKGLGALGAMTLLPGILTSGNHSDTQLHFVGLGQGGTNAMVYIHEKGIEAKYSCITGSYVEHLKPEMEHLFFETPQDYRIGGIHYKKPMAITSEVKAMLSENHRYIILTGLGASVGTGLISSVIDFLNAEQKDYHAICCLPSLNMGRAKRTYAEEKKAEIEDRKNVLFFDQQTVACGIVSDPPVYKKVQFSDGQTFILANGHSPIDQIFDRGDELFYNFFESVKS